MANEYSVNASDLTAVADAIRTKGGTTDALTFPGGFVDAIGAIRAGGGDSEELADLVSLIDDTGVNVTCESITVIANQCLRYRTNLVSVSMPNLTKIGTWGFANCTKLESVNFPALEITATGSLGNNTALKEIVLPAMSIVASQTFTGCSALERIDLPVCHTLQTGACGNCAKLTKLILRYTNVVGLPNVNAFNGTPFASGGTGGTVYVPAALLESYKTATNWSTLYAAGACNFAAIEGSEYE